MVLVMIPGQGYRPRQGHFQCLGYILRGPEAAGVSIAPAKEEGPFFPNCSPFARGAKPVFSPANCDSSLRSYLRPVGRQLSLAVSKLKTCVAEQMSYEYHEECAALGGP